MNVARTRPRVLLVEDEGIILVDLELSLEEIGYDIAGTASSLERGLELARDLPIDVAVLDVDLAGRCSAPIADVLDGRGIPFVFASGFTCTTLPAEHRSRPLVAKPFSTSMLALAMGTALAAGAS